MSTRIIKGLFIRFLISVKKWLWHKIKRNMNISEGTVNETEVGKAGATDEYMLYG